jgi:hypothetical protein
MFFVSLLPLSVLLPLEPRNVFRVSLVAMREIRCID